MRYGRMRYGLLLSTVALAMAAWPGTAQESAKQRAEVPPDCEARVAYDRDTVLPGYLLPTKDGPRTCVPFSTVAALPPAGYTGDFYVDMFSDVELRRRWQDCKADKHCRDRVFKIVTARHPPNREFRYRDPHVRHLLGKVTEALDGELDLKAVRRPAFFARAPYSEPFAALDGAVHTVEFAAPRDSYERLHMGMRDSVRIRGWYVRGNGVDDGQGGRKRALVVMTTGGGGRISAIEHPEDELYRIDKDGQTELIDYPNHRTGATGQALWRQTAANFNAAGFDVLMYDRRGVGMSSGYSDTNTIQQGRDILAMIASLRSGAGLRALSPTGVTLEGKAAADAMRGTATALPVLLFGNSRGTMSSGWAMTANFDKDCTYEMPEIVCSPARGDTSIKGAMLLAEFTSGPGYVMSNTSKEDEERGLGRDRPLFIAGNQVEHNLVFFPSSAILAGMHRWPAVFMARGLWDYAGALEGSMDSYRRVAGPKELVVVRAPHPVESWPDSEKARVRDRMIVFARAVISGATSIPGGRLWTDRKSLVATASDVWEKSTRPNVR